MKRRIIAATLTVLMSLSSTPVFASSQNSVEGEKTKTLKVSAFPIKSVDGPEVVLQGEGNIKKSNKDVEINENIKKLNNKSMDQLKSNSESNYAKAKAIADEKASVLINKYGCASVQYALIDNGKIVLSGNSGVYSKEDNKPITADNMYNVASISKVLTTTAIMKLVDSGQVNLDAPITEYIVDFKMADERYKKITVRMLLNHSSGLMGFSASNSNLFDDNDSYGHDTFIKQLSTQRLKADPGSCSVYCNDGFSLAEILIERVSGISYTEYVTRNIIEPLKMNNTKTPMSKFDKSKLAKAYCDGIDKALPIESFNALGTAGFYSTAEDLCKFATIFTKDSSGIISKKAVKDMGNKEYLRGIWPEDGDNIFGYGLGWDSVNLYPFNQYGIKAVTKCGDSSFYHSNLIVLPEQNMAMAIVASGGNGIYNEIMGNEVLLSALKEKGVIKDILPNKTFKAPEKVVVPEDVKKYEGLYASAWGFIEAKIDEAGTLNILNLDKPENAIKPSVYTKDGTFVSEDGSSSFKFVKQSNGKIYLEQFGYSTLPDMGQTAMILYLAQKEENKKLPEDIAKAWEKRKGKKYYLLNEKYSSSEYILSYPVLQVESKKGREEYFDMDKIVGENLAVSNLDGPGSLSSEQKDYTFYSKDDFEYISSNNQIYVEEAAIKTLPTNSKFTCQINNKGYAEWYKISDESAGKEITVDIPKNAAFVTYDSNGVLINDSLVTGNNKVKLPKDGRIVFLGDKKSKFTVQYSAN